METTTSRAATAEKLVSHYIKHINRDFRPAVVDYDAQRAIYEDPRLAEYVF